MSNTEANVKTSIWHMDLRENKITRFLLLCICVPAYLVLFFVGTIWWGVIPTTFYFICLHGTMWLYDRWQERKPHTYPLTPEEQEALLCFSFEDYWYLRDRFIDLMQDIENPTEGPWYDRNSVRWFITLWENDWPIESITRQLYEFGRKTHTDQRRIAHLRAIAKNIGKTLDNSAHFDSRPLSPKEVASINSFFREITTTLLSIDHWFASHYWPPRFQPNELWGESQSISLQNAVANAPFLEQNEKS